MSPGDGVIITHRAEIKRGSVGCFLAYGDRRYFTIARHMSFPDLPDNEVKELVVRSLNGTVEGKISIYSNPSIDTTLVRITQGNFGPHPNSLLGVHNTNFQQVILTSLWNPAVIAAGAGELTVSHLGATLRKNDPEQVGQFNGKIRYNPLYHKDDQRLQMQERRTYRGDSGGPVFTELGELVGFISEGDQEDSSTNTTIVLAHYVLPEFVRHYKGLSLWG